MSKSTSPTADIERLLIKTRTDDVQVPKIQTDTGMVYKIIFRNPNYHLPSDTIDTLDFTFIAELVKKPRTYTP
jgi:hypothetical protein